MALSTLVSIPVIIHLVQLSQTTAILQAIAIYTFLGVWMTRTISSMRITLGVVLVIWIFDAILVIIGFELHRSDKESFMEPAPVSLTLILLLWSLNSE